MFYYVEHEIIPKYRGSGKDISGFIYLKELT